MRTEIAATDSPDAPPSTRRRPAASETLELCRRYGSVALCMAVLWTLNSFGFSSLAGRNDFNNYLIYALLVLGFYWVYGLTGQFSFAQAGFAAMGAYTSAWLSREGMPLVQAVVAATLLTGLGAGLLLVILRKASGFYFAIATLGLGSLAIFVIQNWDAFTGGSDGQTSVLAAFRWNGAPLTSFQISGVLLAVLSGALLLGVLIDLSPMRRDATALKYRPNVARVCGVRDLATKMSLFALGSAIAALAGALQSYANGFIATESYGVDLAVGIFLMIVVGGENYLCGCVIGAAFYVFFPRILDNLGMGDWVNFLYGATLVLFMIFMPAGILGGLGRVRRALQGLWKVASTDRRPRPLIGSESKSHLGVLDEAEDHSVGAPTGIADVGSRLTVSDLRVAFGGVHAVDGVTFDLGQGEVLGLVGPNGSGKSTTLNALSGLVSSRGEVRINGEMIRHSSPGAIRRRGVIRAFQTPQIYPELSCLDNVILADADRRGATLFHAVFRPFFVRCMERRRAERARAALQLLAAGELIDRPTNALSYGEQRWVELSRSIVADAHVVLLDEPSAGLNDQETQRLGDVVRLLRDRGASIILVDHKVDFISSICDRVIVLDFGKVIAEGGPVDVFHDPLVIEAYVGVHDADAVSGVPGDVLPTRVLHDDAHRDEHTGQL